MKFQEPRPTYFCKACQRMIRHQPIPHDDAHCECKFEGSLICDCDCHKESLAPIEVTA